MERSTTAGLGLVAVLVAAGVVYGTAPRRPVSSTPPSPSASASAAASATAAPSSSAASDEFDDGGVLAVFDEGDGGANLPVGAPRQVGFAVVLFTYRGAQFAPADARSKDEALALAKSVIETAKTDFAAAVKKGDRGSTTDAGRIPRRVLEPSVEYALFTLDKGAVAPEPVDTPRGYWVVKRTD